MLPHYSPLKVAETFTILAGLFPGRIDLGHRPRRGHRPADHVRPAARPPRTPRRTTSPSSSPSCSATSTTTSLPIIRSARLAATLPGRPELPEPWLLGSSPQSAIWAAELGLPYAFADFINPGGAEIAALYRERFVAARPASQPGRRWPHGCSARRQRRGGAASRGQQPDDPDAAAPRPADRGPAAGEGARVPRARGHSRQPAALPGRRGIIGSPETVRAGHRGAGSRVRRRAR